MSDYKHRMSLAVPQALMTQANQLALIVGESEHDDKTFTAANWQDSEGNLYAVCSTVIKPIVLTLFGQSLDDAPLDDDNADKTLAQQALDAAVMFTEGVTANTDTIVIAVDVEPLSALEQMGLSLVVDDEV